MKEQEFQRQARLYLGQQRDLVIWRNAMGRTLNVSFGEMKGIVAIATGPAKAALEGILKRGVTPYGLAPGSGDLIGIHSPSGRFVSIELKKDDGVMRAEQELFLELINRNGGYADVAKNQADLERCMRGLRAPR